MKEQCNEADDSKEQQDLNLLEKRQEYRRGVGEELTRDEWKKLNEIESSHSQSTRNGHLRSMPRR